MPDPSLPLPWLKASEVYFTTSAARLYSNNVVYVGTHLGEDNYGTQGADQWHLVDLKPYGVSSDAISAFLSGVLIITHGITPETADMRIVFRRPGDLSCSTEAMIGQVIEGAIGGGQRSTMATWVPLEDGCFAYSYSLSTPGDWPVNSGYGVNLSLQAWSR